MDYKINKDYIEINNPITCESDVLDIISLCMSNSINMIVLREGTLTDNFINLRTGLAGIVLQKFMNYNITASAVIEMELEGRFKELVYELNKANNFRVFDNKLDAENWILNITGKGDEND
ncbi:DUF4180 domain-containing protein [Clostridium sp.]|uniref:DUF4180 domain-containing protein n=1 Tax=Clostridium sp. TaxID=1506 RepID=UPI001B55C240|nr:DUF4180 domain-containing protein [Clostridium sp.]MBP3915920.1 DUF4180 domain-containing protein [Clostridium sp.]